LKGKEKEKVDIHTMRDKFKEKSKDANPNFKATKAVLLMFYNLDTKKEIEDVFRQFTVDVDKFD